MSDASSKVDIIMMVLLCGSDRYLLGQVIELDAIHDITIFRGNLQPQPPKLAPAEGPDLHLRINTEPKSLKSARSLLPGLLKLIKN